MLDPIPCGSPNSRRILLVLSAFCGLSASIQSLPGAWPKGPPQPQSYLGKSGVFTRFHALSAHLVMKHNEAPKKIEESLSCTIYWPISLLILCKSSTIGRILYMIFVFCIFLVAQNSSAWHGWWGPTAKLIPHTAGTPLVHTPEKMRQKTLETMEQSPIITNHHWS